GRAESAAARSGRPRHRAPWRRPGGGLTRSRLDPGPGRVVERLGRDRPGDPAAEHLHLDSGTGNGVLDGQIGVGDAPVDRVAITAAGNPAQRSMIDPYRLAAERDPAGLVEQDRTELARDALLSGANQGLFADEVDRLAQTDGKTEPGLVGVVLGGDVAAPDPVSLLQSH